MTCLLDSGVGGLSVLKDLLALWKNEDFVYLADTAHLPFGSLTPAEIRHYTADALSFFASLGADRALLACGTASAHALDFCKDLFPFPLLGVTDCTAFSAANATKSLHIGVAATEASVKSGVYSTSIRRFLPAAEITEIACPSLVSMAESGTHSAEEGYRAVAAALSSLKDKKIDTLVLGCTHFSLLKDSFAAFFPSVTLIDCAKEAATAFANAFCPKEKGKRTVHLFTSGNTAAFSKRARHILGEYYPIRKIRINN